MIFLTKPILPNIFKLILSLGSLYFSRVLTNNGKYNKLLTKNLKNYLKVENITLVDNATNGLLSILDVMNVKGSVITTPYAFPSSINALINRGLRPIFVDIDYKSLCIDSSLIEKSIKKDTTAILAVNALGISNNFKVLSTIAKKHNLKLIYDAAASFGIFKNKKSVLSFGDASVVSFHATKVFNMLEGGAVITNNKSVKEKLDKYINFGFENEFKIKYLGLNYKIDEFNCIVGYHNLKKINHYIDKRRKIYFQYHNVLSNELHFAIPNNQLKNYNFSYVPIRFNNKSIANKIYQIIKKIGFYARFYYMPSIFNYHSINTKNLDLTNMKKIDQCILCLPIYPSLSKFKVSKIINLIKRNINEF